ncbi:MAG: hypothetical protein JW801_19375 [Bacteroidales bacterium]|nr:hypothetical protein [Bacteroidales bacterium]
MKPASIALIKSELKNTHPSQLVDICLRMAKFKIENKELLTYLLFEVEDEATYIRDIKLEMEELFESMNLQSLYLAKKTIRKVQRQINKYIRISGMKTTEVELRIHFCRTLKGSGLRLEQNRVVRNLYLREQERIIKAINCLHEDLQHDYFEELNSLYT